MKNFSLLLTLALVCLVGLSVSSQDSTGRDGYPSRLLANASEGAVNGSFGYVDNNGTSMNWTNGTVVIIDDTANITDKSNIVYVQIVVFVKYGCSVAQFNASGGVEKYLAQCAATLGRVCYIDQLYEGSTVIFSHANIVANNDPASIAAAQALAAQGGAKMDAAVAAGTMNIIPGVSLLDYKSSVEVTNPNASTSSSKGPNKAVIIPLSIILPLFGIISGVAGYVFYKRRYANKAKSGGAKQGETGKAYEIVSPNSPGSVASPQTDSENAHKLTTN